MSLELEAVALRLKAAVTPAEVFTTTDLAEARREYLRLARVVHEDLYRHPEEKLCARIAFQRLQNLWNRAQNGHRVTFATAKYVYTVGARLHHGGTCGVFEGTAQPRVGAEHQTVIRIPHSAADNDLMERESKSLTALSKKATSLGTEGDFFMARLPRLLESAKIQEPGRTDQRRVNAVTMTSAVGGPWYSLAHIREAYPEGVESRAAIFMVNRLLEALTFAHSAGLCHGAVTPNHVLIHPESHLGALIDWTASGKAGEEAPYQDKAFTAWFDGHPRILTPGRDLQAASWCAVFLLGGDPTSQAIPSAVEEPLRDFLNECLQARPLWRTANAARDELKRVAKLLYGPDRFVQFTMPAVPAN